MLDGGAALHRRAAERFTRDSLERRMSSRATTFAFLALLALPVFAQPSTPTSRIPTVTRLVKIFSELEARLATQALSSDASALDQSLDPSFEMRTAAAPGVPVTRDEWISQTRAASAHAPGIAQMAVHDFGDVAIVSFREVVGDAKAARRANQRFIVDCWKRDGPSWKLAVRYQSDVSPQAAPRAKPAGTIDKRY